MKMITNFKVLWIQLVVLLTLLVAYAGTPNADSRNTTSLNQTTHLETIADTGETMNNCEQPSCRSEENGEENEDREESDDDGDKHGNDEDDDDEESDDDKDEGDDEEEDDDKSDDGEDDDEDDD